MVFEAEEAVAVWGGFQAGDGGVADIAYAGGHGGHFQGDEDGAVVEFEAGAPHVGEEFAIAV